MISDTRRPQFNQRGVTLIEMIATVVILAIALLGVSLAIQSGVGRSGQTLIELRAAALGQAYLDEILSRRYDEKSNNNGIPPCRASAALPQQCTAESSFGFNYGSPVESGENSRARLDDVDDYHGLIEGDGQALPLQDAQGNTRTGYENFTVEVNVRYINVGAGEEEFDLVAVNPPALDDQFDAKLITITVTYRGLSEGFQFSAYKSNF